MIVSNARPVRQNWDWSKGRRGAVLVILVPHQDQEMTLVRQNAISYQIMHAIVLSCDRYAPMAAHMVRTYRECWPDHPFVFRIPYQQAPWPVAWRDPAIEFVPSPAPIIATVEILLRDLPDDEWIYWCVDDKWMIDVDVAAVQRLHDWLNELVEPAVSGLIFCRCRNLLHNEHVCSRTNTMTPAGEVLLKRRNYHQFWIHQYLRVRVLRDAFRRFPGEPSHAKQLDTWTGQEPGRGEVWRVPPDEIRYVTERNLAVFGESTDHGRLLSACAVNMQRLGIPPPADFPCIQADIRMGAALGSLRG